MTQCRNTISCEQQFTLTLDKNKLKESKTAWIMSHILVVFFFFFFFILYWNAVIRLCPWELHCFLKSKILLFKSLILMNSDAFAFGHRYIVLVIRIVATVMVWILVEEISTIGGLLQQLNKHIYSDRACQNDQQSQCTRHLSSPLLAHVMPRRENFLAV